MTTFQYSIEVGDESRQRFERVEAWVDTGASYTMVPRTIMERLGYTATYRRPFRLSDGSIVELDLCRVNLRLGQDIQFSLCVFGDEQSEPLLGATALEEFGLGVDPVNHALMPIVLNLLGFRPEEHDDQGS